MEVAGSRVPDKPVEREVVVTTGAGAALLDGRGTCVARVANLDWVREPGDASLDDGRDVSLSAAERRPEVLGVGRPLEPVRGRGIPVVVDDVWLLPAE